MPNGHGGIPRYGSPILLLFVLLALATIEPRTSSGWTKIVAYPIAALLGWRTAWHAVMYPVMEYGGAYSSEKDLSSARRRFRWATFVGVSIAVSAVGLLWPTQVTPQ